MSNSHLCNFQVNQINILAAGQIFLVSFVSHFGRYKNRLNSNENIANGTLLDFIKVHPS